MVGGPTGVAWPHLLPPRVRTLVLQLAGFLQAHRQGGARLARLARRYRQPGLEFGDRRFECIHPAGETLQTPPYGDAVQQLFDVLEHVLGPVPRFVVPPPPILAEHRHHGRRYDGGLLQPAHHSFRIDVPNLPSRPETKVARDPLLGAELPVNCVRPVLRPRASSGRCAAGCRPQRDDIGSEYMAQPVSHRMIEVALAPRKGTNGRDGNKRFSRNRLMRSKLSTGRSKTLRNRIASFGCFSGATLCGAPLCL